MVTTDVSFAMSIQSRIFSLILVVTASLLFSPVVYGEDLLEVVRLAQENDAQLQVARQQRDGATEQLPQSLSALLPSADFSASRSETKQHTYDRDQYATSGYSLSLNIPALHMDRIASYRQAEAGVAGAEHQFLAEEQMLLLRAATHYFDVLAAADNLTLAQTEAKAVARQLKLAEEGLKAGTAVITDLQEAQAGADAAQAQVLAASNNLQSSMETLMEVIGPQSKDFVILPLKSDSILPAPIPEDSDVWVTMALEKNHSLAMRKAAVTQAEQGVEKSKAGHYPTVDVSVRHMVQDNEASAIWYGGNQRNETITAQLNVPIFSGGMTQSRVRQAVYALEEARKNLEKTVRHIQRETRNAFRDWITSLAQVKAFTQSRDSSASALDSIRASREVGFRTMLDVLKGERDFYQAERNLSNARYGTILASLKLKMSAGVLSVQDLEQINGWLGTSKHEESAGENDAHEYHD
ncbi:MAG: TolC family outer membrane protein [Nitrospirae bacterium]|nr:TolC family outer membrane protein [Magnetococcales bacterium]HAT51060.1 channel protein TolC [Alphaproteobacteria bacterium]